MRYEFLYVISLLSVLILIVCFFVKAKSAIPLRRTPFFWYTFIAEHILKFCNLCLAFWGAKYRLAPTWAPRFNRLRYFFMRKRK